jgi:hypothetical protein
MKLSDILVRLALAGILMATPACDPGGGSGDADAPRARRSRGAPLGELRKDNVSKVTYPVAAAADASAAELGTWHTGRLEPSDPVLDDRTHYDTWTLSGERGERYIITMESQDFDAFLMIAGPLEGDIAVLAEDDDSAGGTDARVEFVIPRTGSYAVIANSVFPAERGAYRIRIDVAEATMSRPGGQRTADER